MVLYNFRSLDLAKVNQFIVKQKVEKAPQTERSWQPLTFFTHLVFVVMPSLPENTCLPCSDDVNGLAEYSQLWELYMLHR